jgi:IG-like fold at C-terminal of FixG, putative oxidoreductase
VLISTNRAQFAVDANIDEVMDRGALARAVEEGTVENVCRIQIMNRTERTETYRVAASDIEGLDT